MVRLLIENLSLTNFRICREIELAPCQGINILQGQNAQGKTTVLEAIWLLATTRSLRAQREGEMVAQGESAAAVNATILTEHRGQVELLVNVQCNDRKSVTVNGSKRPRVVDLLGSLNVVFFSANDLPLLDGEPADRRHFLNMEISQISPRYVHDFAQYRRILEQRNRLLKDIRDHRTSLESSGLAEWTTQLISYGAVISNKRSEYLRQLAPLACEAHKELTDGLEELELRYLPGFALPEWPSAVAERRSEAWYADEPLEADQDTTNEYIPAPEQIAHAFQAQLDQVLNDELRRGTTLLGPQRDDIQFVINGRNARLYGSQGQQRTAALAVKLAEYRLIEQQVGEPPVLLLDDVMSDLDDARRTHLMHWANGANQVFITCTNLRFLPDTMRDRSAIYRMEKGELTLWSDQ